MVPLASSDPTAQNYSLRWFTPDEEEKLCGHATLATTHVLTTLAAADDPAKYTFQTLSGQLTAARLLNGDIELDFPADDLIPIEGEKHAHFVAKAERAALGKAEVVNVWQGRLDVIVELKMHNGVRLADLNVDYNELARISSEFL